MGKEVSLSVTKALAITFAVGMLIGGLLGFTLRSSLGGGVGRQPGGLQERIRNIKEKVLPERGSKTGYGITFSQKGMREMVGWYENVELSGEDRERYIKLGSREGTACGYCCGAAATVGEGGKVTCGCKHNVALAGLMKHLVRSSDLENSGVVEEVRNWKAYFFPKQVLGEELKKRGISLTSAGLPEMRGGC